jgi:two-component system sporulation sensor kinase C
MQKNLLRAAIALLIKNSVEATPENGMISIETCRDKDDVVLKISDSGSGMSEEAIDKIFDPFFSTKKHGFGMGLPLVKQIVSEHLGEIKVESELEKGTKFHLIFPFRWTNGKQN